MVSRLNIFIGFFVLTLIIGCKVNKDDKTIKTLKFSIAEEIPVPEPSGLDLTYDESGFWVVSDENSTVYLIDSWGKVVKNFKVNGYDLIPLMEDVSQLLIELQNRRPEGCPYVLVPPERYDHIQQVSDF